MNRFASMLIRINSACKKGDKSCIIISNKLCVNVLRLFREYHFIFGFSYISDKKGNKALYPKIKVYLKYSDNHLPIFKNINVCKNTNSNFILKKAVILPFNYNQRFLITTPKGIFLTNDIHFFAKREYVKILANITV